MVYPPSELNQELPISTSKSSNKHQSRMRLAIIFLIICSAIGVSYLAVQYLFHAGGLGRIHAIIATDYLYSEIMSVPLVFNEGYQAGKTHTYFESDKNLAEICNQIREIADTKEYQTELFDENNLLIRKSFNSSYKNSALYMIRKKSNSDEFYFFDLSADFAQYDSSNKAYTETVKMIFPYHLVNDERFDGKYSGFKMNVYYSTEYGPDEFHEFYSALNAYKIERTDNQLFITGYLFDTTLSPRIPAFSTPVAIHFKTANNQNYFKLTRTITP